MRTFMVTLALASAVSAAPVDSHDAVLIREYYRFRVADAAQTQAQTIAQHADAKAAEQIRQAVAEWRADRLRLIRTQLGKQFGARAREMFGQFVEEFTQAEKQGDAEYLRALATAAGLTPSPGTYDELAAHVLKTDLQKDSEAAANFLSELETWLAVRAKNQNAPPLDAWLRRKEPSGSAITTAGATRSPTPRSQNPLRDAEASVSEFTPPEEGGDAGLVAFSSARSERRARALKEAQAGMQQIAAERDAAEKEYAAAKLAAAQAEAEAMRKHAEKLAAVEQEALEQRKNSWSGRLKQIVSATIGAAGGAFFGGIGSRAGEAAANAIFR